MFWSLGFALLLLAVVLLRYLRPWGERCPQCGTRRPPDAPLCFQCGWIWDAPGDDDDWGDPEDPSLEDESLR